MDAINAEGHETPMASLQKLKKQTEDLKIERKVIARNLKNAKRKSKRLKEKAKCLTTDDLMSLLAMKNSQAAASGSSSSTT